MMGRPPPNIIVKIACLSISFRQVRGRQTGVIYTQAAGTDLIQSWEKAQVDQTSLLK